MNPKQSKPVQWISWGIESLVVLALAPICMAADTPFAFPRTPPRMRKEWEKEERLDETEQHGAG